MVVKEVVKWVDFTTVDYLRTIDDVVLLQLVILGEEKLTFEPRFMYRFLQAAREFNRKHHVSCMEFLIFVTCLPWELIAMHIQLQCLSHMIYESSCCVSIRADSA